MADAADKTNGQTGEALPKSDPAGHFQGESMNRRRALTVASQAVGGIAGAIIVLPAVGFSLAPIFEKPEELWEGVGPTSRFTADAYKPVVFTLVEGIGEAGKTTAFVRQGSPKYGEKSSEYVAISTRCAHLGCPVNYVAASQSFVCPCHGGVYDFEGKVIGGPPVRPLDRFQTRVVKDEVQIGPRYSVTSQLEPVRYRDPGEFTGGIWEYIYPPRPDTPPAP